LGDNRRWGDALAVSFDGGEDLVCGSDPYERLWFCVSLFDVVCDCAFEFMNAAMGAALNLLFGEFGEEAFDEIEP
jgi:hypothetical protein